MWSVILVFPGQYDFLIAFLFGYYLAIGNAVRAHCFTSMCSCCRVAVSVLYWSVRCDCRISI